MAAEGGESGAMEHHTGMSSVVPSVSGIFATDMAGAIASRSRAAEQIEGVKLEILYSFCYFVVLVS